MPHGAGQVAALAAGARLTVDPRATAVAGIREVYEAFPHIGKVLPAVGYSAAQRRALEATINASDAEVVVSATPIDLARQLRIDKPVVRARYDVCELGEPRLSDLVDIFLATASCMSVPSMQPRWG
jgi:predicted GTPase